MESILSVLKCQICSKKFNDTPIVLSCCDATICSHHVNTLNASMDENETSKVTYECELCFFLHNMANKRFPTNKVVEKLLRMKFDKLEFGKTHENASEECENLEFTLNDLDLICKDPKNFIYEHVAHLKRLVDLRKERLKLEIDALSDVMIVRLETFQKECYENLERIYIKEMLNEAGSALSETQAKLNDWKNELELLVINEAKWKEIHKEAKELDIKLMKHVVGAKEDLLMHKIWSHSNNPDLAKNFSQELIVFDE